MVEKVDLPPAMILAGGLSRRMGGGDKGLLRLGSRPILGHVIARLRPQVSMLALNANGDAGRFAAFRLPVVGDSVPGFVGPLAGILAAMAWAEGAAPSVTHVLTVPADTPFLPPDLARRLHEAIRDADDSAIAVRQGRRHPVIGLWPVSRRAALAAALASGLRKVEAWTEQSGVQAVGFDEGEEDPFFNVNTPDDLAAAEARLSA